ncbi:double-stranded RNA-binding protein 1 isoform X4 [Vitis vinifera]|uniref:double-stranded RNA-binding protein 1 isoform X4 n=1 Tax=Vitis vinifera TaxID=29760 RepID=UPI0008FFA186|nr:double-stranded RNA-binding protein 1 isoform X4 [Vitis vinifera]|eukprot:XP_019075946.1 PREDICTED: double-stranded RNA-binding protein 1-like isoform X4 [Vitis vinifera]
MYKAKLQELSQQKRWGLPRYTAMKDGPDHLPHFKASVYVNGLSFHSPTISTSSKQAHNQAAKLAFLHFASSSAETMAEGQNTEEAIQSFESHSSTLAVTNCSLKPMGHQDDRDSNIGKKYQSTEIHSHALAVKDAPRDEKPKTGETNHSTETHSHGSSVRNGEYLQDLQYQYKSQLQNYARSKNLDAPLYSSKCDGPHHALRFKATVTIDGHTFGSPEFFNTLKKAEHAAAKVALMSLLQDDFQEDDSGFYKNVLLELAQKELFCIPKYETVKCGPSHMPTFFSTVKVDGEIFHGKAGRSKKQAEMKAAKAAYTAFKDRASRRRAEFTSPDSPADKVLKSSAASVQVTTVDSQQNLEAQLPLLSSSTIDYEEHAEETKAGEGFNSSASTNQVISVDSEKYVIPGCSLLSSLPVSYEEHAKENKDEVQEVDSAEISSATANATTQDTRSSLLVLDIDKMNTKGNSTACSESVPVAPKEDSVPMMAPLDLSASSTEMTTSKMSYLLCGRVRVYPCFPDVSFPKGITVLPIREDKWVAMSLEFPNEKGN